MVEEKESVDANQPLIINTAEFYGEPKSLKKIVKRDEVDEREKFIEAEKQSSSIGENDAVTDKAPAELRLIKKAGVGLGKLLLKLLKFLLKFVLILLGIIVLVFVLYGILAHFTELEFLQGVDAWIDGLFGWGLLTKFTNFLGTIFA